MNGHAVKIKLSRFDRGFVTANTSLLILCALAVIYPLIYIVSASFSSPDALASGRVWLLPVEPSLRGYGAVFRSQKIWIGYRNSVLYAVVGTSLNIVMTILAGYTLSRKDFLGRGLIMKGMVFTMLFSSPIVTSYLLVHRLGLIDTFWAMIFPSAMNVMNVIITRTYFQSSIPMDLYYAAEMDGCSDIQIITRIVLPLSKPIIAVMVLFYALNHWNAYFHALLYLNREQLFPLQLILREIFMMNEIDPNMLETAFSDAELQQRQDIKDLLKYAIIIVANAPMLMAYPFVQRYFVKGVMIGAIKG